MRKLSLLLLVLSLFVTVSPLRAQLQATEGTVESKKQKKLAALIELPFPPERVESAIKEYIAQKGVVKTEKANGFSIYRNLSLNTQEAGLTDLHFKVERKSRKEKNTSIVYLLAGRPGENMSVRTDDDRYKLEEAKEFLNGMVPFVEANNLDKDIEEQQTLFTKEEKKLASLQDEQKSLEKKLDANKKQQEKQQEALKKQKSVLEAMLNRKKSSS